MSMSVVAAADDNTSYDDNHQILQPSQQYRNHPLVVGEQQRQDHDPNKPFFPIYYNDVYEVKLPQNHRFPMEKYRKVRQLVQGRLAEQKNTYHHDDDIVCNFYVSPLVTMDELTTTHCPNYVERYLRGTLTEMELRNVGFPWSHHGVLRSLSSVGGTVAAAVSVCNVLQQQQQHPDDTSSSVVTCWSGHVAGGTHHAFYDYGEGFCVFNDIAVAANVVRQQYPTLIRRVLIIDLDVHQGNGSAVLFSGRNDVMTFSMHCGGNYFSPREQSDLDVELPVNCTDETYLVTLRHWLKQIDDHGGQFDLVFFQAGVDGLAEDRLGRMNLTAEGLKRRNDVVFDFAWSKQVPLVLTMGGGYPRGGDWTPILDAHANVYVQAAQYLAKKYQTVNVAAA